jgi:hypothetical protein
VTSQYQQYCYSDSPETLSRNERGRFGALKSDSTHHFFRNACTNQIKLFGNNHEIKKLNFQDDLE